MSFFCCFSLFSFGERLIYPLYLIDFFIRKIEYILFLHFPKLYYFV